MNPGFFWASQPGAWIQVFLFGLLLLGSWGCSAHQSARALSGDVVVHTFRRGYTNAHVVARGSEAFLVDAGLEVNAPLLDEDLRSAGIEPGRLRAVVLSHGHADHAGGASYFRRKYGVPIVAGREDRELLEHGHNDNLCSTSGDAEDRRKADQAATFAPFQADVWIDGPVDLAPLTGIPGKILPLAGHTRGSLIVVVADAALVGDLFRGAVLGSSAELHYYMCDVPGNRRSIRELVTRLAPAAQTFFTGHFGAVSREAVQAQFLSENR